jgi:hypothetical protein
MTQTISKRTTPYWKQVHSFSLDVTADAGFLCDEAVVLEEEI